MSIQFLQMIIIPSIWKGKKVFRKHFLLKEKKSKQNFQQTPIPGTVLTLCSKEKIIRKSQETKQRWPIVLRCLREEVKGWLGDPGPSCFSGGKGQSQPAEKDGQSSSLWQSSPLQAVSFPLPSLLKILLWGAFRIQFGNWWTLLEKVWRMFMDTEEWVG